jgi:enoyl-CoA hydratase/carnithine racemase
MDNPQRLSLHEDFPPSSFRNDFSMPGTTCQIEERQGIRILSLQSEDGTNRLTQAVVLSMTETLRHLAASPRPLIITGNGRFFSAGADLNEIAALNGPDAYAFSKMGQQLMHSIENFPAPAYAAIFGYCMGGGLDLALACHQRLASPNAVFGHRGAAFGLITGWGGTQRLPRLIGKARAFEIQLCADKVLASRALEIGLVNAIAHDPVAEAMHRTTAGPRRTAQRRTEIR